jgi:hypothetical protein
MNSFETSTTVQASGDVRVVGVPFAPGTEVEVMISPKRKDAAEFSLAWERVCREMRKLPQMESISDNQIQNEIDDYRAGR